ncbi:MAG: Glycogen accumulation regulator GarA [bacterium ADurb.Bin270]|nr:FHA domain-containing protein [Myxococcales bacterium]OQA60339.1 MAG: Glycogen accumulation regulator GarA [bacterium ADurb.Bin270]HQG13080.1 FHA domain-containing protein [bacterium]HQH80081.1 FHA domain-containing protein [bacterium]
MAEENNSEEALIEETIGDLSEAEWAPALTVISGRGEGSCIPVGDGEFIIGRLKDCGLRVDDNSVSRRHAKIDQRHGRFTITDLGSKWGTKINGQAVDRAEIKFGDKIEIAGTLISFDLKRRAEFCLKKGRDKLKMFIIALAVLVFVGIAAIAYFRYNVQQNMSMPGGDVLAQIMSNYDSGIYYYNKIDSDPVKNKQLCLEHMNAVVDLDPTGKTRFSRSARRIIEGLE